MRTKLEFRYIYLFVHRHSYEFPHFHEHVCAMEEVMGCVLAAGELVVLTH